MHWPWLERQRNHRALDSLVQATFERDHLVEDSRLVEVRIDECLIARTRRAVRVLETASPPTFYLPREDINTGLLRPASEHSVCEWKGQASYFDLRVFQLLPESGFVEDSALPADAVVKLREQLDVAPDDRFVILIGKDGGEKRRAELRTELRDIFRQIDAMPMRRDEMRTKTEAGVKVTLP